MDQHGSLIRYPVLMVYMYLFCSPTKTVSCFFNVHNKILTRITRQKIHFQSSPTHILLSSFRVGNKICKDR